MLSKKGKIIELLNQGINDVSTLAEKSGASLGYTLTLKKEYERNKIQDERKKAQERLVITDKLLKEIVRVANWPQAPGLVYVKCLHGDIECNECSKAYWQKTEHGYRAPCVIEGEYDKESIIPRLERMKNIKIRTALEDAYGIYLDKEPFGDNPDTVAYIAMPEKLQKDIIERFGKGNEDVARLRIKASLLEKIFE